MGAENNPVKRGRGRLPAPSTVGKLSKVKTYPLEVKLALIEEILDRISNGEPLRQICRSEGMPSWVAVYDWIDSDPIFASRFAHARELGEEAIHQECLAIADSPLIGDETEEDSEGRVKTRRSDMLGHRKLQIETRLKLLAKWNPKKYGERMALAGDAESPIKIEQTLDVSKLSTEVLAQIIAAKNETNES